MDVSFVKFLVKLAEVTEGKIAARVKQLSGYTLKHWGGQAASGTARLALWGQYFAPKRNGKGIC